MERYTIQDIEFTGRKSGISYQEAVALLDYHNGNVTRCAGGFGAQRQNQTRV